MEDLQTSLRVAGTFSLRPNDTISLEVHLENDTVWLSQAQMTELFGSTKQNISLHINNIFKEGELKQISVVKDFLTTALDGKKYRTNITI